MISMRKMPIPHPHVQICCDKRKLEDSINDDYTAGFLPGSNVITFYYGSDDEDEAIDSLLHELEHWAQFMFLDRDERGDVCEKYTMESEIGVWPFLERHNRMHKRPWNIRSKKVSREYSNRKGNKQREE